MSHIEKYITAVIRAEIRMRGGPEALRALSPHEADECQTPAAAGKYVQKWVEMWVYDETEGQEGIVADLAPAALEVADWEVLGLWCLQRWTRTV